MTGERGETFLTPISARYRGTCGDLFYTAIREGAKEPGAIVERVRALARKRLRETFKLNLSSEFDERSLAYTTFCDLIEADRDGARDFAALALVRCGETKEEKSARKERESAEGIQAHMERQPPTQKQLDYLQSLGCTETPANRRVASEWIDQYVKDQARRSHR